MARLVAQTLAMLVAGGLVYALVRRAGLRLPLTRATAVAVVAFLAVLSASGVRDTFDSLGDQRKANAAYTPDGAKAYCVVDTRPNPKFLAWVQRRIPGRAKYVMSIPEAMDISTGTCIRFLLLPRIQVADLDDADYVVLWESFPPPLISELARRGAVVQTFDDDHRIARLP